MALFKRKKDVIDLGEHLRKKEEAEEKRASEIQPKETTSSPFAMFDTPQMTESSEETIDLTSATDSSHEKKRRLAKRILEMTNKLEDLSNQIYHLQQRIELLERKTGVN